MLSLVENQGAIIAKAAGDPCFIVSTPLRVYRFERDINGQHTMVDPRHEAKTSLITVADNEALYDKREIQGAKKARELERRLGYPSAASLARGVNAGSIIGLTTTAADIARAIDIYGASIPILKGKSVNKTVHPVHPNQVIRTRERQLLYMDIMYVTADTADTAGDELRRDRLRYLRRDTGWLNKPASASHTGIELLDRGH